MLLLKNYLLRQLLQEIYFDFVNGKHWKFYEISLSVFVEVNL